MIFTSYFGNMKRLNELRSAVPIAICGKSPAWWGGAEMKELAPSYSIWSEYQKTHDEQLYRDRFYHENLAKLDPQDIYYKIKELSGNRHGYFSRPDAVLMCYEKSGDFCHRRIVADWLSVNLKINIYEITKEGARPFEEFNDNELAIIETALGRKFTTNDFHNAALVSRQGTSVADAVELIKVGLWN